MSTTYPDLSYTSFPDAEQSFVEMTDLTMSDGALMTQYQQAMMNGDFATARTALSQIPNYNNKILDSVKMNTLFDTTVALERFYKTDIKPYIEQKQEEWEQLVQLLTGGLLYVGEYQEGESYKQNNIVSSYSYSAGDNLLYLAIQDNSAPLTDTNSWRLLTIKGAPGISGEGLVFMGTWSSTISYNVGDVVVEDNTLWKAIQANSNQQPSTTSGYWQEYGPFTTLKIVVSPTKPDNLNIGDFWFQVVS